MVDIPAVFLYNKHEVKSMEFGDRVQALRKRAGLSQEKLAEKLGISRQAVSKWEAGQSQPEMEKLVALCELFGVGLDELVRGVKNDAQQPNLGGRQWETLFGMPAYHYEYKSKRTVFGMPLLHVNVGWGRPYVAKGIFAVGGIAVGVVSLGGIAFGVFAFGALALGLLSFAGIAVGLLACGGMAAGGAALGGAAVGIFAFGGLAAGKYAVGGAAFASDIAVGGFARGHIAIVEAENGAKTFFLNHRQLPAMQTEQVRAMILREYPHIWKPLLHFLTMF